MAVGRKSQPQERAFGDEILAIACVALAVFFTLALYSYQADGSRTNQMGLAGHVVADFFRPMLGQMCYVLPSACVVVAAILLRLLLVPAPISQTLAFLLFTLAGSAFLDLSNVDKREVANAGGWAGGLFVAHLREVLNYAGSYVALTPVLLVSFMVMTRLSLGWAMEAVATLVVKCVTTPLARVWSRLQARPGILPRWSRSSQEREPEPELVPSFVKNRVQKKDSPAKKSAPPPVVEEEEDESLPPIIISRPSLPAPTSTKNVPSKPLPVRQTHASAGNGKPYVMPSVSLLDPPVRLAVKVDEEALHASSRILESKLSDFGVDGKVLAVRPGPVITTYEFEPAPGVKVSRVTSLVDDLQMALRAVSVRILAPIRGQAVVGIEVSNPRREKVCLREIIDSPGFQQSESPLTLALGKDTVGNAIVADLARMPHMLVAGATGMGKSVSLNAMIMSLLFRASPRDCRFIMIDPKMLELSLYEELPHQLSPVITNAKEAGAALQEVVRRMEQRYRLLKDKGVRSIAAYNRLMETGVAGLDGVIKLTQVVEDWEEEEDLLPMPKEVPSGMALNHERLPYLVVIVDELADLMLTVGREIEEPITRLAQMGRAAGIHLILATQRPSVDVITGIIKANFPARVSFKVSSRVDSRTILDSMGAERLLGEGDMLFLPPGSTDLQRLHGAFVSEAEIRKAVNAIKKQGKPVYDTEFVAALERAQSEKGADGSSEEEEQDEMYEQARDLVMESRQASISWLQRRLRVGYNRAARMIERMEREGLIAPTAEAGKPREVLVQGGRRE
ncbi:MAG: DNA translocase FtsK 4TM domain-containing protein [Deltaproteobacteria bacterium]|nr:DNA translocase FtsK 4TM domain-containing protein [Deltaproteobacteria bacterium]